MMATDVAANDAPMPLAEVASDPVAEAPEANSGDAKPAKEAKGKAKKPAAPRKPRANPSHPPYAEVHTWPEALLNLILLPFAKFSRGCLVSSVFWI